MVKSGRENFLLNEKISFISGGGGRGENEAEYRAKNALEV